MLHCTTKFCDYGKAAGAEEYAQQDVSGSPGTWLKRGVGRVLWRPETRQPLRKSGVCPSLCFCSLSGTKLSGPARQCRQLLLSPRGLPLLQMLRECWLLSLCSVPKARSPLGPGDWCSEVPVPSLRPGRALEWGVSSDGKAYWLRGTSPFPACRLPPSPTYSYGILNHLAWRPGAPG